MNSKSSNWCPSLQNIGNAYQTCLPAQGFWDARQQNQSAHQPWTNQPQWALEEDPHQPPVYMPNTTRCHKLALKQRHLLYRTMSGHNVITDWFQAF